MSMNKRINFEDNFFIMMMRIRLIRDIITLDASPELFLEKTLDDIYFIDHTLRILLEHLADSRHLFERDEFFDQLSGTEKHFSQVLEDFINHDGNLSIQEIPSLKEKLDIFRQTSLERQKQIRKLISVVEEDNSDSAELTELLKAL